MRNTTRKQFDQYRSQIAAINDVAVEALSSKFTVAPSVQQKLEDRIQESSEFLQRINVAGVVEQEGEVLGLTVNGPIAGTQDTTAGDRQTRDVTSLVKNVYRCEQINYDTHLSYAKLDAWAKFPNFQARVRDAIIKRMALDRMMIGFNGTSRAVTSNLGTNPLLQDVSVGWLQNLRTIAPERVLDEVSGAPGKVPVGGAAAKYKNLDALVMDVVNSLIDPWHREDTELVAICGRDIMADKYFPLVNQTQVPSEQKAAADIVSSQKRIGGLQAVAVPFFPANAILVTRFDNLSIYFQEGAQRRSVIDNPKRDRVETYQSSNDDFVIEDYGCAAMIENIEIAASSGG